MDGYQLDQQRYRTVRRLAMYEGMARSVAARAAYARELVEAAGMDMDEWRGLSVIEREAVLRRGKRALRRAGLHP